MTLKKARALVAAGSFCLAGALGAQAAQLYPGCAQPGPTGKVWWVDPVNGKTPTDDGDGSQAHPWNALQGVLFLSFPKATHARCCRASPTITSSRASAFTLRTSLADRPSSPATRSC